MKKSCLLHKLLVINMIDFKRYPSTYCLMQGRCFICSNFQNWKNIYLKIRPTTYKYLMQYKFLSGENIKRLHRLFNSFDCIIIGFHSNFLYEKNTLTMYSLFNYSF